MFKAIIVEDNSMHSEVLRQQLLRHCPGITIQSRIESVEQGRLVLEQERPDILFTDVELHDGNCFDLLANLPSISFELIFTTAHSDYAIQAIKYSALDYLLKPIGEHELKAAVHKAERRIEQRTVETRKKIELLRNSLPSGKGKMLRTLALPSIEGYTIVEVQNIIRMEANSNCSNIYMLNGDIHVVSRRLKVYEEMLSDHGFFRTHHSSLINLKHVLRYRRGKGGTVFMRDGSSVEVSVRRKDTFLELLTQAR